MRSENQWVICKKYKNYYVEKNQNNEKKNPGIGLIEYLVILCRLLLQPWSVQNNNVPKVDNDIKQRNSGEYL